jgi:hypothetical protein
VPAEACSATSGTPRIDVNGVDSCPVGVAANADW